MGPSDRVLLGGVQIDATWEYDGSIYVATAMRPYVTITVATCICLLILHIACYCRVIHRRLSWLLDHIISCKLPFFAHRMKLIA